MPRSTRRVDTARKVRSPHYWNERWAVPTLQVSRACAPRRAHLMFLLTMSMPTQEEPNMHRAPVLVLAFVLSVVAISTSSAHAAEPFSLTASGGGTTITATGDN